MRLCPTVPKRQSVAVVSRCPWSRRCVGAIRSSSCRRSSPTSQSTKGLMWPARGVGPGMKHPSPRGCHRVSSGRGCRVRRVGAIATSGAGCGWRPPPCGWPFAPPSHGVRPPSIPQGQGAARGVRGPYHHYPELVEGPLQRLSLSAVGMPSNLLGASVERLRAHRGPPRASGAYRAMTARLRAGAVSLAPSLSEGGT
jgi:hypothetical protein